MRDRLKGFLAYNIEILAEYLYYVKDRGVGGSLGSKFPALCRFSWKR